MDYTDKELLDGFKKGILDIVKGEEMGINLMKNYHIGEDKDIYHTLITLNSVFTLAYAIDSYEKTLLRLIKGD